MRVTVKKKLIEVALPLEAINREAAREKSIRHGHPSTLHLWWARRPLAACRAVLFASLVDDPSSHPEKFSTEEAQEAERQRLFRIIEELVKWENSNNERVLDAARMEILASTGGNPPPVYDPFCGGGSIPLEAQRLGLEAHASDLNPVAVLITKALIEIPPKFAGKPPVHPEAKRLTHIWKGAAGLAEDVRQYGKWMRDEAEKRIGHLYPKVKLAKEHGGGEATVIAWLWARTVKCPNPACGAEMPLVRSFALSTKKGKEVHVEPVVSGNKYRFDVKKGGKVPEPPKVSRGAKFRCLCCAQVAPDEHIKAEGMAGRMDARLMSIVAEGQQGRIYLPPSDEHERVARSAKPSWVPEGELAYEPRAIWCTLYGPKKFTDLFTPRQLVALTTFSELVGEARERALADARSAGLPDDGKGLESGGTGAQAYADAIATYLGFALSKATSRNCTLAIWEVGMGRLAGALGRQALPMSWDFAETNPIAGAGGDIAGTAASVSEVVERLGWSPVGEAYQADAALAVRDELTLVATDPPYYDNIGYADLSDFFYSWLRPTLREVYPQLMGTMQVPKGPELVATPYRFDGDKNKARAFFEEGLGKVFEQLRKIQDASYPLTVYYAFKQSETEDNDDDERSQTHVSTGWESMLEALLEAGFTIQGTWPVRSELIGSLKKDVNALATSIVLVCRPRTANAPIVTRGEFVRALKSELPTALKKLQHGNVAPVDLAQSAIGPGMAIFSHYSKVLDTKGEPVRVREALALINQVLDEVLAQQEGDFDSDTRWALAWFEQMGFGEGKFGDAETLSKAKNTSVSGMVNAGILESKGGRVSLLKPEELPSDWDPDDDGRLTVWETTHQLIRLLNADGETAAANLAAKLGSKAEVARELAYRLYTLCERKKRAQEALTYNALVQSWPEITRLAREAGSSPTELPTLFERR